MGAPELTSHYNVILSNQDNFAKIFFFTLHFFEKKDLPPKKNVLLRLWKAAQRPKCIANGRVALSSIDVKGDCFARSALRKDKKGIDGSL